MVDMALIGGLANSLNIATNLTKLTIGLRDQALIQEKIVELTNQIISVQQIAINGVAAQTTLTERVRDLEKEIMDMKTWDAEKQRYQLQAVSPTVFAYTLKPDAAGAEPPHWLCVACYQKGKKSILGTVGRLQHDHMWQCPICSAKFSVPWAISPEKLAKRTEESH